MRKGQDQVQRAHGPGEAEQGHEHQARAYHPGDLVYYKRHQAPAEGRSHQKLDVPRRQISRWFGPARILGLETKVTYDGQVRQPHRMAWLISQGRLKRVHTDQLRHASEREKLTNEEFHDILATPWTFTDVTNVLTWWNYPIYNEADLMMSNLDVLPAVDVVDRREQTQLQDHAVHLQQRPRRRRRS